MFCRSNVNKQTEFQCAIDALEHWFIINSLKTKPPLVDAILAKIYFDTYNIPCIETIDEIKQLSKEYEADIIRFFLTCQYMRCNYARKFIQDAFKNINIVLPIQCKPFFEEMLTLYEKMQQHNIMTKESEVLDSLRDTIISNSLNDQEYHALFRPQNPVRIITSGNYILTDDEKMAYLGLLSSAIYKHFSPMFGQNIGHHADRVYALTDIYQDSGTRFERVIDYIKSALFMVCASIDKRICCPNWATKSIVPSTQEDMFSVIELLYRNAGLDGSILDDINKNVSKYGGLSITHAICLPCETPADLQIFSLEKNAISLTYKFFVCQSMLSRMHPECCCEQGDIASGQPLYGVSR